MYKALKDAYSWIFVVFCGMEGHFSQVETHVGSRKC